MNLLKPKLLTLAICFGLVVLGFVAWVVRSNGGKFVYTLDDPYIHLALSQRISEGHYGINIGEYSAPSSSIVWPLLLAPLAATRVAEYMPLAYCVLAAFATIAVAVSKFGRSYNPWLVAAGVTIVTNQIGLIFTGMEHNLQVLLALVAAVGLLDELDTGQASPWLLSALALGPLVRYENLCITLPSATFLWIRGHRRAALTSVAIPGILIILFSVMLKSMGLGMLPSSIVAKSGAGNGGNPAIDLLKNFKRNLLNHDTLLECYSFIVLLAGTGIAALRLKDSNRLLAATALAAGMMHMFVGRFGWAGRYEPYIVCFDAVLLLGLWASFTTKGEPAGKYDLLPSVALGVSMLSLGVYYVFHRAALVAAESHKIYLQQYQMHRFVLEDWRKPIAVNDLGWVSWKNDQYVLDLWGLGNYEALKLRATETNSEWMDRLCKAHGVAAAMVYDEWFEHAPKAWVKVAMLSRAQGKVLRQDEVSIYATTANSAAALKTALSKFAPKLPPGATLIFASN